MRIKHTVLALVINHARLLKQTCAVIITSYHALQIKLSVLRSTAIHEEGLVNLWCIHRHRDMLHRIGGQTTGIFVSILLGLTKGKPDTPVAIYGRVYMWK